MTTNRGQHLIGKELGSCVLEKLLGYGGSSAVFLAQQHNPDRKVAVKVFLPRPNMDVQMRKDFYNRFLHEAEAASQLDHPNILPIYAYGEQDGLPYIVMPYMPGGTLSEYVRKHGALSLQEVQWYLEQIASALDYAHTHHCVHCDVKPANILIDDEGHVMLSDFGISRILQSNVAEQEGTKNPEALMGTPDYVSPEQAMGRSLDGRSDIYSLGITIFFLLAKRLPFIADTSIALALLHVHEAPPSLALMRADISPLLDNVVRKALAKAPEKRFQMAGDFSTAFAQAVAQSATRVPAAKLPRILAGAGHIGVDSQPTLVAATPVVRVKPLGLRRFSKTRLAALASLLLVVIVVAVLSTSYLVTHFPSGTASIPASVAHPTISNLSNDLLANRSSWASGPMFFYDNQARYHMFNKAPQGAPLISRYEGHKYNNFQLSVTMEEIRNANNSTSSYGDFYGIVFRSAADEADYYLFEVRGSAIQHSAEYVLVRYDQGTPRTQSFGPVPSLLTASGTSNTVTVRAQGNNFTFTINNKPVGNPISDSSQTPLKSGQIGLLVEKQGTEVAFSHLYISSLT